MNRRDAFAVLTALACFWGQIPSEPRGLWVPPAGIPDVPDGLEPDRATPPQDLHCPNWPNEVSAGCYYVDNTHSQARDDSNANGTPSTPRLTLPGTVTFERIEVKGGGTHYRVTPSTWTGNGSPGRMAALVGSGAPVISSAQQQIKLGGAWVLVEGLTFDNTGIDANGVDFDNALIRRVTMRNWTGSSTRAAFGFAYRGSGQSAFNENIVIYDTVVTNFGNMEAWTEQDNLGAAAGDGARNWWVVDNHWYDIAGDSIRTGTNVGRGHAPNRASNIYIGRNHFHDNFENAIDVKNSVNVVISQNQMHGFTPSVSSSAEAVVIHEHAVNTAIVFNTIHSAGVGVSASNGRQSNVWIVGNVFYGLAGPEDPEVSATLGSAVVFSAFSGHSSIVGNTFHDNDRDIRIEVGGGSATDNVDIVNNLFAGTKSTGAMILFHNATEHSQATVSHNLFPSRGRAARVQLGTTGRRFTSLASYVSSHPAKCSGCLEGEAAFIDVGTRDYSIGPGSKAKDVGAPDPQVYAVLAAAFGIPFTFDRFGVSRSLHRPWDIGAYAYRSGQASAIPLPVRQGVGAQLPELLLASRVPAIPSK